MAIAQETQAWIDGMKAVGFTEEQLKPMLEVMEAKPEAANYLKRSVLAPAVLSRELDTLTKEKASAAEEMRKAQEWNKATTDWRNGKEKDWERMEKAEARMKRVDAKLSELKTQGYIDDNMLAGINDVAGVVATVSPASPTQKFLTEEDFKQRAGQASANVAKFSGRLAKLARQHETLFSKRGDDPGDYSMPEFDEEKIIEHLDKNGGNLEQAYAAVYPADDRRKLISQRDTDSRVEKLAEEKYQKRISSEIQAGRPVAFKPVESQLRKMAGTVPEASKNPQQKRFERVNRAVAALESQRGVA